MFWFLFSYKCTYISLLKKLKKLYMKLWYRSVTHAIEGMVTMLMFYPFGYFKKKTFIASSIHHLNTCVICFRSWCQFCSTFLSVKTLNVWYILAGPFPCLGNWPNQSLLFYYMRVHAWNSVRGMSYIRMWMFCTMNDCFLARVHIPN